jgi:hypothetical protein
MKVGCGTVAIWKKCAKVVANSDQPSTQGRVSHHRGVGRIVGRCSRSTHFDGICPKVLRRRRTSSRKFPGYKSLQAHGAVGKISAASRLRADRTRRSRLDRISASTRNQAAVILDDRESLGDPYHTNAMRLCSQRQSAIMSRHH